MDEIKVGSICRTNLSQPGGLVRVLSIEPYSEGSSKMYATIEHIEAHPYGYAAGTRGGYMIEDLVLVHECEEESCTSIEAREYHWLVVEPGESDVVWYCDDHAAEAGFCLWCGHFGAGSEEYDFSRHKGYHRDCFEEMRYDVGDFDEEEDWYDDPYGYGDEDYGDDEL
jgi:hypothetical protein